MGSAELPMRLVFGRGDEFGDVITSLGSARFVTGDEPYAQEFSAEGVSRAADLVPIGTVVRHVTETHAERVLAQAEGWTVLVQRFRNGRADVAVSAAGAELLAKTVADVVARCPVVEPKPDAIEVDFWYGDRNGPRFVSRRLDAPTWPEISAHYAAPARDAVNALVAGTPREDGGRLILWHGPPGTGKTTAIRSLARSWSGWCRTLFVVDPERFLGEASYLMSVLLGADDHDDDDEERPTWRLIVIEDADELLRADAKKETGQSLSRLLNLADGFIGRGLRTLVMITTNEPLGRLHPAVVRPGRCLAEVEFPALSPAEAAALIGDGHAVHDDVTLAEVFLRRGRISRLSSQPVDMAGTGQYL
jgi:hypothetical protein